MVISTGMPSGNFASGNSSALRPEKVQIAEAWVCPRMKLR